METLAADPPASQTLDPPIPPPQLAAPPEPTQTGAPSPGPDSKTLAPETKTLTVAVPDYHELGLGSPPEGSPIQENLKEAETGGGSSGGGEFAVGDFVWGKIKSHPWWPGQVYDPSRASEHAKNASRKENSVLVAYFGDGSFAWCEPAQLKPFRAEEFAQMVKQGSTKGFAAAVSDAVHVIGQHLESRLTCGCVPVRVKLDGEVPVDNYTPVEFLERLCNVAKAASVTDLLEATMLRSWAVALGKGSVSSGSFEYRPRPEAAELVDRMELDTQLSVDTAVDTVAGEQGKVEHLTIGYVKKPAISEEALSHARKRRSMAKLIAEMDLDAVEISDTEVNEETSGKPLPSKEKDHEEKRSFGVSDAPGVGIKIEEEAGSGLSRRERKKSKYLSPPYTFPKGYNWLSGSPEDAQSKTPTKVGEASRTMRLRSPTFSRDDSSDDENHDKQNQVYKIGSTPVEKILSEFLSVAVNPLHLKWNHSAKTIRGFFSCYRSMMYSNGLESDADQNGLSNSTPATRKSANKDLTDRHEGTSEREKRKRGTNEKNLPGSVQDTNLLDQERYGARRKTRKGDHGVSLGDFSQDATYNADEGKSGSKRKMRAKGAEKVSLLEADQNLVDSSGQRKTGSKRKKPKDGAADETPTGLILDASDSSKQVKYGPKEKTRQVAAKIKDLVDLNVQITNSSEEGKFPQKKKQGANGITEGRVMTASEEQTNGAGAGKADQKFIEDKEVSGQGNPIEFKPVLVGCLEGGVKGKDGPGGQTSADTNGAETVKSRQRRKKRDNITSGNRTAILLTFAPGVVLPSKEHLISTFRKYGDLIETETELLNESGCARVVFARSADAEKAFNSPDKSVAFGSPVPSYRLCHLPGNLSSPSQIPVQKPPLPYIRKSLERMISTLSGSSSPEKDAESSEVLKPEARENLVGEMKGLLQKVNKMLDGPAGGASS